MNSKKTQKQTRSVVSCMGLTTIAAILVGLSSQAFAQEETGPRVTGLEELVITAQRREESSQDASISISTLTGDAIKGAGISRPGQLTDLVPALQSVDAAGPYSIFYVRGVGSFAANAFSDSALSFNVDGVSIPKSSTSGFFYDLERVEVLKGPQGTLYGRNATGGAINVITKKPELEEFGGNASIEYGDYSSKRLDAAVNVPLSETSAMRVAVFSDEHDGYMADGTDQQDDVGGRLSFVFLPGSNLDISLVADYFDQGSKLAGATVTGLNSSFGTPPNFSAGDRLGLYSPQVEAFIQSQFNALNGNFMVPFADNGFADNQYWGLSSEINWSSDAGTLTVIPAYRSTEQDFIRWSSGVQVREANENKQNSLEVRFASNEEGPLSYIVGAYYLDESIDVPLFQINQQSVLSSQEYSLDTQSQAVFASLNFNLTDVLTLTAGARYTKDQKDFMGELTSNSIICDPDFNFAPNFAGCLGRPVNVFPYDQLVNPGFSDDRAGATGTYTTAPVNYTTDESDEYSKTTWRVGLEWQVAEENMVYTSYETGFKAGGFFFSQYDTTYDPEEINAITLGSKNRFLDNRLQLNLELYHWTYEEQQFSHLSSEPNASGFGSILIFPTENIGDATIKGVELGIQAQLADFTLLTADIQYNDAVYDNFVYNAPNQNGGVNNGTGCPNAEGTNPNADGFYTVDCSGQTAPYSPEWSLSAGLQQVFRMSSGGDLVANARVHYQSETLTGGEFLAVQMQDSYQTWDFDLTYHAAEDRFFVGGYLNNAFDETVLGFSFPVPLSGFQSANLRPPRTYGIRLGMEF